MQSARQTSLFITIIIWGTLIGGVMYSHIVYFPSYLSQLPESNSLITGAYGLQDGNFWMLVHPVAILSTILTLFLNWKLEARRKFIIITLVIYVLAIIATIVYFLPGLKAFADSNNSTDITKAEWFQRGKTWQYLSWVRGFFMYAGFFSLLIALTKDGKVPNKSQDRLQAPVIPGDTRKYPSPITVNS